MDKQIVISFKTVLFTALFALVAYIIYKLGAVLGVLAFAAFVVIAVESLVKYVMSKKLFGKAISRGFAVSVTFAAIIGVLILTLTLGAPPVVSQLQRLYVGINKILTDPQFTALLARLNISSTDLVPQLTKVSGGALSLTLSVFVNFTSLISFIILSVYMSLDWENIKRSFISLFPEKYEDTVRDTFYEMETNVGQWVKGQLFLMLVIGVFSFIGLEILGVEYALALGLISGILEVVPIMGPVISAVIAGIVGFSDSPVKGIGVVVLFTIIQRAENDLLVPRIMQKVSGFSPIVILVALLVGSSFFGVIGALIAIPVTMILTVLVKKVLAAGSV